MKKNVGIYCILLTGILLAGLAGCSESTQKQPEAQPAVQQTAEQTEMAAKQLEFAEQYMETAKKGIIPYSQAVALCRDIIKNNPGTEYEAAARQLLAEVPQDQRSRYNITRQELGL